MEVNLGTEHVHFNYRKETTMLKVDKEKGKAPCPPHSHTDSGASILTRGQSH